MTPAVAAEAVEYNPAAHATQLLAADKPEAVPYVPAAQFKQVDTLCAAKAVEYKPEPQAAHVSQAVHTLGVVREPHTCSSPMATTG